MTGHETVLAAATALTLLSSSEAHAERWQTIASDSYTSAAEQDVPSSCLKGDWETCSNELDLMQTRCASYAEAHRGQLSDELIGPCTTNLDYQKRFRAQLMAAHLAKFENVMRGVLWDYLAAQTAAACSIRSEGWFTPFLRDYVQQAMGHYASQFWLTDDEARRGAQNALARIVHPDCNALNETTLIRLDHIQWRLTNGYH